MVEVDDLASLTPMALFSVVSRHHCHLMYSLKLVNPAVRGGLFNFLVTTFGDDGRKEYLLHQRQTWLTPA